MEIKHQTLYLKRILSELLYGSEQIIQEKHLSRITVVETKFICRVMGETKGKRIKYDRI